MTKRKSKRDFGQGVKAALYCRVSTHEQQTLPMQLASLRRYAKRRGWKAAMTVQEIGSGAKNRPQREQIVAAVRRGEIDAVVVWRLDRWGRSVVDLLHTLQEFQSLGVGFVSVTEALDLTTPSGRAMAGMLAVFAEFERELIRERVKAGVAEARRKGKRLGRPPSARAHAAKVRAEHAKGQSKRRIARKLGISRSSVRRLLGNPVL